MSILSGILQLGALIGELSQLLTNGGNPLGTLQAPLLPQFLTNNPLPNGFPWSTATTSNTNPYTSYPITGVIRPYDFTITRGYLAPDGVNKSVLLVNGQFPAPTIEVNWGDTIQVTVHNQISGPEEGVGLHWHGILQKLTPWYDGVPAVQQCPIAPGSSFTYSFIADLYGTTWYHSHYSAQYAGGLIGPLIVHGPTNVPYDIDVGPVLLSDHYWHDYYSIVQSIEMPGVVGIPRSDNNLINGKGNANCAAAAVTVPGASCVPNAGLAKFRFKSGKVHRLRLINAGAEAIQRFTIDGHNMTVIANDFVPITPYNTNVVTLGIGQRTDVLVVGTDSPTAAVWMRSDISAHCSVGSTTGGSNALAAIYYENANTTSIPNTTATAYDDTHCGNDDLSLTTPVYPITPPATPAVTQTININFGLNSTGYFVWMMNGQSFRANYDHPLLLLANLGNTSYPDDPQWNVYDFGKNTSIRIILSNFIGAAHPMHLHGHNYWVISEGPGPWDGVTVQGNPANPQRRDVQILQPGSAANPSHLVIEFNADNPGVWPLHCHIAWHVSAGLYVNVLERPDLITQKQIPFVLAQTCRDWAQFSGHNVVDQIDSGL